MVRKVVISGGKEVILMGIGTWGFWGASNFPLLALGGKYMGVHFISIG